MRFTQTKREEAYADPEIFPLRQPVLSKENTAAHEFNIREDRQA